MSEISDFVICTEFLAISVSCYCNENLEFGVLPGFLTGPVLNGCQMQ